MWFAALLLLGQIGMVAHELHHHLDARHVDDDDQCAYCAVMHQSGAAPTITPLIQPIRQVNFFVYAFPQPIEAVRDDYCPNHFNSRGPPILSSLYI